MKQFIKYNIVSVIVLGMNIGLVFVLTEYLGIHYLISVTLSFLVCIGIEFFINRRFTFKKNVFFKIGYPKAVVVATIILLSIVAQTYVLTEWCGVNYIYSRLIASILAGLIGYVLDLKYVFKL